MASSSSKTNGTAMHYLAKEHWSPRFDATFFTVDVTALQLLQDGPTAPPSIGGKASHPATYFAVQVFTERKSHTCWRRYSHFKWLHDQLLSGGPSLPPSTCPWQTQDEAFLQVRLDALRDYLRDVLERPGYASDPAMKVFLELERCCSTNGS